MSSTIVNVAIPDMSHYFALGQERAPQPVPKPQPEKQEED